MTTFKAISLSTLLAISALTVDAKVTLPSLISDGIVLQRGEPITIWGKADPGETVNVALSKKVKASTVASSDGTWSVSLKAQKASGPYTLTVNDLAVNDVMIGDVYLFSGQSNMELPISRVKEMFPEEIASYTNHFIREFKTPKHEAYAGPQDDVTSTPWKTIEGNNIDNFGALAYFTAKKLYEQNGGVAIGIINSSWGGSRIEAWISADGIKDYPLRYNNYRIMANDRYRNLITQTENTAMSTWNGVLWSSDLGTQSSPKWYSPDLDDSDWTEYDMFDTAWGKDNGRAINGVHWLRRNVSIPQSFVGKQAQLRLGCIVDADSVYVNGTFVGTVAYQYPPRNYTIPAGVLHEGSNNVTVRIISDSGTPHFVADKPYKIIVDGQEVSLEGLWRHKVGTVMPQKPSTTWFFNYPTVLYNGMIAPVLNIPVQGVVWYQGESDVDIRDQYPALLNSMVNDWRKAFNNPTLPFYIVELADFLHPSDVQGRKAWAEMRQNQAKACDSIDGATLIRNGDVGEWNDIHPKDKKTPGNRTAEAILSHK